MTKVVFIGIMAGVLIIVGLTSQHYGLTTNTFKVPGAPKTDNQATEFGSPCDFTGIVCPNKGIVADTQEGFLGSLSRFATIALNVGGALLQMVTFQTPMPVLPALIIGGIIATGMVYFIAAFFWPGRG